MSLFFLAIAAGFLTILAPCILPVLPFLLGTSGGRSKWRPVAIVGGFVASFSLIGAAFATVGTFLGISNDALRMLAGVLLLLFGAALLFEEVYDRLSSKIAPFLTRMGTGISGNSNMKSDALSGFVVGLSLGLVWAPCAGPILGTIIALAARSKDYVTTMLLFLAYGIGAGIPMLAIAYGSSRIQQRLRVAGKAWKTINRILGLLVMLTAVGILTGYDRVVQAWVVEHTPSITVLEPVPKVPGTLVPGTEVPGTEVSGTPSGLPVLADQMPEFSNVSAWLNSPALTPAALKGKVVLVDFWTYSCINCIRTLPYTTAWWNKYHDKDFVIVGVHTPEFAFEKVQSNVEKAIKQYQIGYPVAMDNDYGTWNAYGNQYWPAEYLFDAQGRLRHVHFGEGEYDQTESDIQALIAEAGQKADMTMVAPAGATDFSKINSQETYLGYTRMKFRGSPENVTHDAPQTYSAADKPALNKFYFTGTWNVGGESARPVNVGAGITYRYQANKINLVMGSTDGKPVKAKITIDGKAQPDLTVQEQRLYQLYDDNGSYGDHVMHIEFEGTNIAVYAFTFG